jgi:hypothetical protein
VAGGLVPRKAAVPSHRAGVTASRRSENGHFGDEPTVNEEPTTTAEVSEPAGIAR